MTPTDRSDFLKVLVVIHSKVVFIPSTS